MVGLSFENKSWEDLDDETKEELIRKGYDKLNIFHGLDILAFERECDRLLEGFDLEKYKKYDKMVDELQKYEYYPYTNKYRIKDEERVCSYSSSVDYKKPSLGHVFYRNYRQPTEVDNFFDIFHACLDRDMYNRNDFHKYRFMIKIVNEYRLSNIQIVVLLLNYDLMNTIYIEDSLRKVYGEKNSLIPNNIDKIINNLKLLISDDVEENLTFNALGNLRDSFIFYTDVGEIIKQFPSIRVIDIIRLVAGKNIKNNEELFSYIELLDSMDNLEKNNLFVAINNIFTVSLKFPTISDGKANEKGKKIVDANPRFFKEYKDFFEEEFDLEYLLKIKDKANREEIIKSFAAFKIALYENITSYVDTLSVTDIYKQIYDLEKGYNCGEYETVSKEVFDRREFRGTLSYGLKKIEKQKDLFSKLKEESLKDAFSLDSFINMYMNCATDTSECAMLFSILKAYNGLTSGEKGKILEKQLT